MNTLFVAAGPIEWGSSRMRCYWPAKYLGADVRTYQEVMADNPRNESIRYFIDAQAVIFQKTVDIYIAQHCQELGKNVFWDVCDPSWWWQPSECRAIADACTGVVASSLALADDFNAWYGSNKAICIPDRLELSHFDKQAEHSDRASRPIRLIWFGVAVNRIALFAALANLERLAANGYKIELTVMDDRPEQPIEWTDAFPIYHLRWTLGSEVRTLAQHDIALLPPYPGPWGKVKSNNKRLTALACGLPAATGENYSALESLVDDADERKIMGECGRKQVERDHNVRQSGQEWEALLAK